MFVSNNSSNTFEISKDDMVCFVLATQPTLEFRGNVLDVNPNRVVIRATSIYDGTTNQNRSYMRESGGGRMALQFSDLLSLERIGNEKG